MSVSDPLFVLSLTLISNYFSRFNLRPSLSPTSLSQTVYPFSLPFFCIIPNSLVLLVCHPYFFIFPLYFSLYVLTLSSSSQTVHLCPPSDSSLLSLPHSSVDLLLFHFSVCLSSSSDCLLLFLSFLFLAQSHFSDFFAVSPPLRSTQSSVSLFTHFSYFWVSVTLFTQGSHNIAVKMTPRHASFGCLLWTKQSRHKAAPVCVFREQM